MIGGLMTVSDERFSRRLYRGIFSDPQLLAKYYNCQHLITYFTRI